MGKTTCLQLRTFSH